MNSPLGCEIFEIYKEGWSVLGQSLMSKGYLQDSCIRTQLNVLESKIENDDDDDDDGFGRRKEERKREWNLYLRCSSSLVVLSWIRSLIPWVLERIFEGGRCTWMRLRPRGREEWRSWPKSLMVDRYLYSTKSMKPYLWKWLESKKILHGMEVVEGYGRDLGMGVRWFDLMEKVRR